MAGHVRAGRRDDAGMSDASPSSRREPPPTSRQIFAIARELAEQACVPWGAARGAGGGGVDHHPRGWGGVWEAAPGGA
jgi:hypothetical protein